VESVARQTIQWPKENDKKTKHHTENQILKKANPMSELVCSGRVISSCYTSVTLLNSGDSYWRRKGCNYNCDNDNLSIFICETHIP